MPYILLLPSILCMIAVTYEDIRVRLVRRTWIVCGQWTLSRWRPGALGFGDVTTSCLVGQSVGCFGLVAFIMWWLIMGVVGVAWIWLWNALHSTSSAPFVPVISVSGVLAMIASVMISLQS